MPKNNVLRGSTSVLDVIDIKLASGGGQTGLGVLSPPNAPTLTAQTTGGTINASTFPTIDVAITYTTTPGKNGAANGETTASSTVQSGTLSGTTASVIVTFNVPPATAGAVNVYAGSHGGTLFLCTAISPVASGQLSVLITTVPTTGSSPPGTNTSWPNGLACIMTHDNDSSATTLPIYVGTAGSWTNPSAPCLTLFELGNGDYQVSLPNVAFSQSGANVVKFKLYGVTGMATRDWSYNVIAYNEQNANTLGLGIYGAATFFVVSNDAAGTTTSFTVNTTGSPAVKNTNGYYSTPPQFLVFNSGTNVGKCVKIGAGGHTVSGAVSTFTIATADALPGAPSVGDTGFIIAGG